MKIALAADHAGYLMKEELKKYLLDKGYEVADYGTDSEASVDYPVYAKALCAGITGGECEKGILVCGTGLGMSIAANKIKGIRAAAVTTEYSAEMSRRHNNANVICLGARVIGIDIAKRITDIFVSTEFDGGKHKKRVDMFE